ncbi:MAG: hypothetical protein DRG25_06705 [Deltaproteobacteria bacterium]|nr:MAG: hypothetical protein DRG25_06705 [Deltaproteobacteria bacterium]
MKQYQSIAQMLIGIGAVILLICFQSQLINTTKSGLSWHQTIGVFIGVAAITTGICIYLRIKG